MKRLCCPRKLAAIHAFAHRAPLLGMLFLYPLALLANISVFEAHMDRPPLLPWVPSVNTIEQLG